MSDPLSAPEALTAFPPTQESPIRPRLVALGEILLALPGVKETRTYAVMEEVKSDGVLPV